MKHEEYHNQVAIFKHHLIAFPFVKFIFIPNASADATTGFFQKEMGLHPGAHDIFLVWNRQSMYAKPSFLQVGIFEVKSRAGKLTSSQNKFASAMHSLGAFTGWGASVRKYHDTLCGWGHQPLHNAIREPDLRTWDEKKTDAFNFYRRPEE